MTESKSAPIPSPEGIINDLLATDQPENFQKSLLDILLEAMSLDCDDQQRNLWISHYRALNHLLGAIAQLQKAEV